MEPVVPKIAINDEDPWTPTISAGSNRMKNLQMEHVSILKSIKFRICCCACMFFSDLRLKRPSFEKSEES